MTVIFISLQGGLTGKKWDVNDGVFLIDLGSQTGRDLALAWHRHFMGTSEAQLREATQWQDVPSDQPRLHEILRKNDNFSERLVHVPRELLNDEKASFVRQVLRTNAGTMEERLSKLRAGIAEAMGGTPDSGKPVSAPPGFLEDPEQYGEAYDTEFRRVLSQYASQARSFLEWGAGYTTRMTIEHIGSQPAEILLTIDSNEEYLNKVVKDFSQLDYLRPKAMSMTGPCVDDRDAGLNYSTYPLSLGRKFDFIFIDGRRRMECAMMALLMAHKDTIVVIHDYRRNRYQAVHGFYDILESGPQFRVMKAKTECVEAATEHFQTVIDGIRAARIPEPVSEPSVVSQAEVQPSAPSISVSNAGDALGRAHKHAQQNELADATAMAQLALRDPDALAGSKTNARLLLASLLERQGRLIEAAQIVAEACADDPENENARLDRDRIAQSLRDYGASDTAMPKAERIAVLATAMELVGWNEEDAKAILGASAGLMRKP